MGKPILIKAGDNRIKLGLDGTPPLVDCRVVAEDEYQEMIYLLRSAEGLVGNPGTGISYSTDEAAELWQRRYKQWKEEN